MNQKEVVGGIIMIAAIIVVAKVAKILMGLFSSIFWILALGVAIYAFINPTFRSGLLSAFRYIYSRVFGK